MSHDKHEQTSILLHPHRIDDRDRYRRHSHPHRDTLYSDCTQRAWVTNALVDAAGSKNQIDLCVLDTGSVTGCNADTNNISANREPNPVNSIVSTTTEDDPVTYLVPCPASG